MPGDGTFRAMESSSTSVANPTVARKRVAKPRAMHPSKRPKIISLFSRLPTELLLLIFFKCDDPNNLIEADTNFQKLAASPWFIARFLEKSPLVPLNPKRTRVPELRWIFPLTPSKVLAICRELRSRCDAGEWNFHLTHSRNLSAVKYILFQCRNTVKFRDAEGFQELAWFVYDNLHGCYDGTKESLDPAILVDYRKIAEVTSKVENDQEFLQQLAEAILFTLIPSGESPDSRRKRISFLALYGSAVMKEQPDRCFALTHHWWPNKVSSAANALEWGTLRAMEACHVRGYNPPSLQQILNVENIDDAMSALSKMTSIEKIDIYRLYFRNDATVFSATPSSGHYDMAIYFENEDACRTWALRRRPEKFYHARDIRFHVERVQSTKASLTAQNGIIFLSCIEDFMKQLHPFMDIDFGSDCKLQCTCRRQRLPWSGRDLLNLVKRIVSVSPDLPPDLLAVKDPLAYLKDVASRERDGCVGCDERIQYHGLYERDQQLCNPRGIDLVRALRADDGRKSLKQELWRPIFDFQYDHVDLIRNAVMKLTNAEIYTLANDNPTLAKFICQLMKIPRDPFTGVFLASQRALWIADGLPTMKKSNAKGSIRCRLLDLVDGFYPRDYFDVVEKLMNNFRELETLVRLIDCWDTFLEHMHGAAYMLGIGRRSDTSEEMDERSEEMDE